MRWHTVVAVLVIAGALVAPAIPAGAAQGQDGTGLGIRLLEAPAERRDDPRAHVYVVDHVPAGSAFTRSIEVVNDTSGPMSVDLYSAAATLEDGRFAVADGRASNELTSWITIEPNHLELAPRAKAPASVRVTVPPSATAGERYAAVLAELPTRPTSQPGVGITSRVGVRVYLSVGDGEPPTSFRLRTFTPGRAGDGRPSIDIQACNTGGRAVDLEGEVSLSEGPGGTSAGPFDSDGLVTVAPGECAVIRVWLPDDLPAGPWLARAVIRSGTVEEVAEARVSFPTAAGRQGRAVPANRVTGSTTGRLAVLFATLLLLLAFFLLLFLWRRRRRDEEGDEPARAASPAVAAPTPERVAR